MFFVLRGRSLTCFDSEQMEDAGRRMVTLPGSTVWGPLPQRTISLSGKTYRVGPGFTTRDAKGHWLEFECVDGHDAEEWARELGSKEGVTRKQNPASNPASPSPPPPNSAGPGPKEEGGASEQESPSKYESAPFVSTDDTNGPEDGDDNFYPKEYVGGASILEPQVLLQSDLSDQDAKWRCWPSGPLPPNPAILGTDQNMRTWDERAHVVDVTADAPNQYGIGIGLKHAYQGIETDGGKFSVQISEIAGGGTAEQARQAGKMRCGDFLLAVDGWSTSQRDITEVCKRIVGPLDSEVTLTVARMVGPHRSFFQPNIWFQMGIVKLNVTLQRRPVAPSKSLWEKVTDPIQSIIKRKECEEQPLAAETPETWERALI